MKRILFKAAVRATSLPVYTAPKIVTSDTAESGSDVEMTDVEEEPDNTEFTGGV